MSGQPGRKAGPLASRPAYPPGRPDPGGCPVRPREGSSRSKTCCGRGPYALVGRHGRFGYLVVGAKEEPAAGDRFVLHVLAQQAGVALAKAHLHGREREQPKDLGAANLALRRSM